jgi:hypothetical protein
MNGKKRIENGTGNNAPGIETAETAAEKAVAEIEADKKENINKAVEQAAVNAVFEKGSAEKESVEKELDKKETDKKETEEKERKAAVSADDLLGKLRGNLGILKQKKSVNTGTANSENNETVGKENQDGNDNKENKESKGGNESKDGKDRKSSDSYEICEEKAAESEDAPDEGSERYETDKSGDSDIAGTETEALALNDIDQIFKAAGTVANEESGKSYLDSEDSDDDEFTESGNASIDNAVRIAVTDSSEAENDVLDSSGDLSEDAEIEADAHDEEKSDDSDDIEDSVISAANSGDFGDSGDSGDSAEPFDDFDSDDSVDDTDVQLMVAFGMDDELVQTVGLDKAAELSENTDKAGKLVLSNDKKKEKEKKEFTSPDQIKTILSDYKSKYRLLLLRMLGGGLLLIFSFLFENLSEFGAKLPNWMDSRTYPVVYTMLGLQLLVLAAVLVKDKLICGYRSFSRFQLTPDSAMFTVTAFSALYEILMCILHFHAVGDKIRFFNFPVILMIFISLIGEYMDLKREIFSFNVVASKKHKFAIESLSEKQATLETAAFAGFMPENSSIFRIAETEFVDGFYSRMKTPVSLRRIINILLPISFGAAVVFFVWDLIMERNIASALTVAEYTLVFGVPFITMLVFSYPFYSASKRAYKIGSAVIGGSSLEEYSCTTSAITFEDKDVFPASGVMVKSIKTYGDSRIDYIIYNVASLFMNVGGPLAEVFESATRDLEHTEDVKLTRVVAGGLEAYISGEHVYCGSFDFFAENGLSVPADPEDEALLDDGAVSIMLLAIDGEVVAKLYVQYMFDRDFEVTIKQFSRLGICVGIKTFDPNITDEMLNRKIRLADYPIKVLRCRTIDDLSVSSEHVDSGVVSKRSVKSMMQAYSLCEKVLHAMKSGIMLKILSMAFAFLIVALVLLFGVGGEICSYQVALYQILWVIPAVFITRLYVTKN